MYKLKVVLDNMFVGGKVLAHLTLLGNVANILLLPVLFNITTIELPVVTFVNV
jgi:hypothetical protein